MAIQSSPIQIRALREIDELKAVEELQREVWGCSEREILPALAMIPLLDIGGILLGAYHGESLVGFVLGFPGFEDGKPILHSDMLAVSSGYRSSGLGYQLKLAQRDFALAKQIHKITWTFDPLQSTNAHLNFGKLGVIADRYKINYYGETSSLLHCIGTDRLWVTWLLDSERVKRRIEDSEVPLLPDEDLPVLLECDQEGEPVMGAIEKAQPFTTIEIPRDINMILQADASRAMRWREATRSAFSSAFTADYFVAEFFRDYRENSKTGVYLLRQAN
ncbi:MAG: GNAT family N-acetyltransferase [Pyrinomonadaceae bacterium]